MARNSIYSLSQTDANNTLANTGVAASNTMNPLLVDDADRANAAWLAELLADSTATTAPGTMNDAGGTANALTVTTNASYTTLVNGRLVSFRATADNTGAATLNVNAIGSKAIRYQSGSGDADLYADAIVTNGLYLCLYSEVANSSAGAWILINPNQQALSLDANLTRYAGGTQPAFRAFQSSTVNLVWDAWTKLTFNNESFDTTSDFSSNRFTPSVEGYYDIKGQINWIQEGNQNRYTMDLAIRKNGAGTINSRWEDRTGTIQRHGLSVSDLVYLNGTTDYVELFCYWNFNGFNAYNPDNNYISGSVYNMFSGVLVLPA